MLTFLAIIHVLACVILVGLVLIQDSKGGGVFNAQTTSNSFLGATGATSLAGNGTKIVAALLAITCIMIAKFTADTKKSVVDGGVMNSGVVNSQPAIPSASDPSQTAQSLPPTAPVPATAPTDAKPLTK